MTTTTKNGQISNKIQGTKKRKAYSRKDKSHSQINAMLDEYARVAGLKDRRAACRKLNIPTSSAKVNTKQMSGYIGSVKAAIRKWKKDNLKCALMV